MFKLYRTSDGIVLAQGDNRRLLSSHLSWDSLLEEPDLLQTAGNLEGFQSAAAVGR